MLFGGMGKGGGFLVLESERARTVQDRLLEYEIQLLQMWGSLVL